MTAASRLYRGWLDVMAKAKRAHAIAQRPRYRCSDDSRLCERCLYAKSRHEGEELWCPA